MSLPWSFKGIRRSGGGRKSAWEKITGLDEAFCRVIAQHTAGSPMNQQVKWTNLTRVEIAQLLKEEGITVSVTVVDQLLEKYNYGVVHYPSANSILLMIFNSGRLASLFF